MIFYRHFRAKVDGFVVEMEQQASSWSTSCTASAARSGRDELPRGTPQGGSGDQPDPDDRRAAGHPDLPDGHHDLLQVRRAADQPADGRRREADRPPERDQRRRQTPPASTRSTASRCRSTTSRRSARRMRAAAGGLKDPIVVINADANATHQSVIHVMEAARLAGLLAHFLRHADADEVAAVRRRAIRGRELPRAALVSLDAGSRRCSRRSRSSSAPRSACAALTYRAGWRRTERLPVPVIVVGNHRRGRHRQDAARRCGSPQRCGPGGFRPAIVSRGYGGANDRPREVADRRRRRPLRRRAAAARASGAACRCGSDATARRPPARGSPPTPIATCVICDDGLQHYALARDFEIAVEDERGYGNGLLLPAGPLREPPSRQVDATVVNGAPARSGAFAMRLRAGRLPRGARSAPHGRRGRAARASACMRSRGSAIRRGSSPRSRRSGSRSRRTRSPTTTRSRPATSISRTATPS